MTLKLLMVENDQDDRQLTEETFCREWPEVSIDFLYGADLPVWLMHTDSRPHLILLAMHAQPLKATEMIKLFRSKTGFETTQIVVLGENTHPQEIQASYLAGANSFIKKPATYGDTLFKIRSFINYWFNAVELPAAGPLA
jgi:DNA-binding response OmpR family regulator